MNTVQLFDLRPIKDLSKTDKSRLPVSIMLKPDGTSLVVSFFMDDIWDLYPGIPQANLSLNRKQIRWSLDLPDGSRLTDPQHSVLLESCKDFIWSLFATPVEGRKRPTMLTVRAKFDNLMPLIRWMVSQGLTRFEQLANRTLDYVPVAKIGESGRYVAAITTAHRLIIVEDLFHQRNKIHDALPVHPWPHESATLLAGEKQDFAHRKPKTELIPDAVAFRLAEIALDYVQVRSKSILAALEASQIAADKKAAAGYCVARQWDARSDTARKAGFAGTLELSKERNRLRTACYIVIDLFSGIRDSEMMSIAENCIATCVSKDGSTELLWLHGTIYKTGARPHRWLVPPVVKETIEVLTRLTAPMRETLRCEAARLEARLKLENCEGKAQLLKRLDTLHKQKDKLFLRFESGAGGDGIGVLSGTSMGMCLKEFCVDLGIFGKDGKPYPLYAHQFRRTYAHFIARSELGDLITLRDHFGHWSIDMAAYYADGGTDDYESDTELLSMITSEKTKRQTDIVAGYLNSNAPLANGNHWLKNWRTSVRTAANKEELIAEYAGTITLNGTGHSWCVGNARGTGCGGLCIFEAQMCVDCNYGIIGPEHRHVWEGIRDQQKEALALDDMGPGGRERAQQILNHADQVLRRLAGPEVTN